MGYGRYDTDEELQLLNELYSYLRLYLNLFQPVRKLIKKERVGSKIKKQYDEAKTPYRRVLASPDILRGDKDAIRKTICYTQSSTTEKGDYQTAE